MGLDRRLHLILLLSSVLLCQCDGEIDHWKGGYLRPTAQIKDADWEKLSQMKIFFGHQSVGFDMVEGIEDVMKEDQKARLHIIQSIDSSLFSSGVFAHSAIGQNKIPASKIEDFKSNMEKGLGNRVDVAFFKFCYIDVNENTDVQKLFSTYRSAMGDLKRAFPATTFIHVTVPLRTVQNGPKVIVKKIIGRPIGGYADNIRRHEFNELMRKEYEGREIIFDLAKVESTYPDGSQFSFTEAGRTYYALVPDYTYDGGHLNEKGRKIVSAQLLALLTTLGES